MKKKLRILIFLVVFFFSSACVFSDWFSSFLKNPAAWIFGQYQRVEITPDIEEAEVAVSVGNETELKEVSPTLLPTPVPTPTLSPYEFAIMFGNFTEEQKAQLAIAYMLDPEGDWIYSNGWLRLISPVSWGSG